MNDFLVGTWHIRPRFNEIVGDGEKIRIPPKYMEVLGSQFLAHPPFPPQIQKPRLELLVDSAAPVFSSLLVSDPPRGDSPVVVGDQAIGD